MSDSLNARMRDEIDDQVAEALDAYLADRLTEPGPLRTALAARRSAWLVLGTIGLGVLATALAPNTVPVACWIWGAIAFVDVAWLLTAQQPLKRS
ncbi:hypothetical protein [Streptomyces sp. NPDC086787]|uniref:hypothetical protein n=1 Tax=Streptomyces sp. NPDC086787 TaxID=3365759 RepID=UPI003803D121